MASATPTTVTVTFDPNAINLQSDIIFAATALKAGVMTADMFAQLVAATSLILADAGPKIFTDLTRPPANDAQFAAAFADGRVAVIWNSDDHQPNYSDGVNWYDASGNLT